MIDTIESRASADGKTLSLVEDTVVEGDLVTTVTETITVGRICPTRTIDRFIVSREMPIVRSPQQQRSTKQISKCCQFEMINRYEHWLCHSDVVPITTITWQRSVSASNHSLRIRIWWKRSFDRSNIISVTEIWFVINTFSMKRRRIKAGFLCLLWSHSSVLHRSAQTFQLFSMHWTHPLQVFYS